MSLLRVLRRPPRPDTIHSLWRCFASSNAKAEAGKAPSAEGKAVPGLALKSSCLENTVLEGVNYLKGQPPVLALADDQYPDWLWTATQPRVIPDDGPGGQAEKYALRKERRQRIREQNFMKTQ